MLGISPSRPQNRPNSWAVLGVCLAALATAIPLAAQEEFGQTPGPDIFPPLRRELRQALNAAERATSEGRFVDTVEILGALLGDTADGATGEESQDYFVPSSNNDGSRVSLRVKVLGMLAALPPAGRDAYEQAYGVAARKLLDEAVAAADFDKLSVVSRRYFHTKAGYEATYLLGRWNLDQGSPLAAALHFQRLIDSPSGAARYEPEISLLLASAWVSAGDSDRARQVLSQWRDKYQPVTVRDGERDVKVFTSADNAVRWLTENFGVRPMTRSGTTHEWLVFGGNSARTAIARGDLPLVYDDMQLRWMTHMLNDPREDDAIHKLAKSAISEGRPELPAMHALAVGDYVLVRTPDRLVGVDFASGKAVWLYPWDQDEAIDPIAVATKSGGVAASLPTPLESRLGRIQERLWRDSPYGMISSDGKAVYLIHELGFAGDGAIQPMRIFFAPGGIRRPNPDFPKPYNQLVSLDLATQGQTNWSVGGENGYDEPKLAGAFFLGPPLPIGDQLYVLAELNSEIRLIGLDPKTGKQQWTQQLALMETPILLDPTRRLAGATPSFGEGVLVCPTAGGAVVGVDVSTRSLLWAHEYRTPPADSPNQPRFIGGGRVIVRPNGQQLATNPGWADGTPLIAQGKVLLTPVESDQLICLNLLTGEKLWSLPRGEGRYLAGVWRDRAVVVNKTSVIAVALADGKLAWDKPIDLPAAENGQGASMPSGRGFLSGDAYFLPTTAAELLKIDLDKGAIADRVKTTQPLGNLICYRDELLSVNGEVLATYYQLAALRRRVTEALRDRPQELWGHLRQAELQLHDGQRLEALKTLRHAGTLVAADDASRDELKGLLISTLLAELRANFSGSKQLAEEVAGLIDERHRGEYLRTMAAGYRSVGEADRALATYLELIDLEFPPAQEGLDPGRPPIEHRGPTWDVRRDRAIQSEIRRLFASASDAQRPLLDQRLRARWEVLRTAGGIGQLRDFVAMFAFHPLAQQARLELAARLIATGDWTEAEQCLILPSEAADASLRASARALLADVFKRVDRLDEAAHLYRELATTYADTPLRDGRTGRDVVAGLAAGTPLGELYRHSPVWQRGQVKATEAAPGTQQPIYGYRRSFPVAMRSRTGPQAEGTQIAFESSTGPALTITDGHGKQLLRLQLNHPSGQRAYYNNYNFNHAHSRGHLVTALVGMEVVAVDALRCVDGADDRILWRADVATYTGILRQPRRASEQIRDNPLGIVRAAAMDPSGTQFGTLGPLLESGVCFQRGRELVCFDPLTGETLWSRNDFEAGCELFGDSEGLVVAPPEKSSPGETPPDEVECVVLDPIDGSELARCKLPSFARRLAFQGRRVLTWSQTGVDMTFQLLDPLDKGQAVWSLTAANGSKGALIGDEVFGVMEPAGRFRLVNLADGAAVIDLTLEAERLGMTDIRLLRNAEQYLLIVNSAPPPIDASVAVRALPGGPQTVLVHGRMYAFDRATGKPQWQAPAFIDQYGLPMDQPADLPVLVFMRLMEVRPPGRGPTIHTQVLFVDRRDGRIRYEKNDLAQNSTYYSLSGDVTQNKVMLELPGNRRITLQFTDEPVAPEPPAQTGKAASAPAPRKSIVAGAADGIFSAFGLGPPLGSPAWPGGGFAPNEQALERMIELDRQRALRPELPAPDLPLIDPFGPPARPAPAPPR